MSSSITPSNRQIDALTMFPSILEDLCRQREGMSSDARYKLKFVKHSQISYDKVESDLVDYLKTFFGSEVFEDVQARVDDLNQESRLCELILEVIYCAEKQMDRHSGMLDDIQEMIGKVRDMEPDGTNFREEAVDKCSLLIYDSFSVLRSMRKKIIEIGKVYHVPVYYDTDGRSISLRSSLITTYKNLNVVIDDFAILSEALWFVRHYHYFGPEEEEDKEEDSAFTTSSSTENSA